MRTQLLAALEKVIEEFIDSDEVQNEYRILIDEETLIAQAAAAVMDAVQAGYEQELEDSEKDNNQE